MRSFLFAVSFVAFLAGCSSTKPIENVRLIEVPVTVFCKVDVPPEIPEPSLPFDEHARKDMTVFQKIRLLAAQERVLRGYVKELQGNNKELRGTLAGCRAPEESK